MKRHPDPNKGDSPYFICDFCARERGGVYFKSCSTSSVRNCGYCDGVYQVEKSIYPSVDYIWPSQAARDPDYYREIAKELAWRLAFHKFPESEADSSTIAPEWRQRVYDDEFLRIMKGWGIE